MELDKFMWLDIAPRHFAIFFENLTSGEAQKCICVHHNLRLLVLFPLAVGMLRDWIPFIILFARTLQVIATRFIVGYTRWVQTLWAKAASHSEHHP